MHPKFLTTIIIYGIKGFAAHVNLFAEWPFSLTMISKLEKGVIGS